MRIGGGGLVGEAGLVKGAVEPLAAAIAGEHPAGAVGSVRRRRQADDQEPCPRVAKVRHRPAPVVASEESLAFFTGDVAAILAQPRARLASDDATVELVPGFGGQGSPPRTIRRVPGDRLFHAATTCSCCGSSSPGKIGKNMVCRATASVLGNEIRCDDCSK